MTKTTFCPEIVNIKSQVPIALAVLRKHPKAVTVLFYPGTMATPNMYACLLQELHNFGCNVVGIHPLGHGLSSKAKKDFTLDDILQNGRDAEAWIQKNFSGPIVVCGHSQGGILALAHSFNNINIAASFPICTLLPHRDDAISVTHFGFLQAYRKKMLYIIGTLTKIMPRLPIPFFAYLSIKKVTANAYKVVSMRTDSSNTYPLSQIYSLFSMDLSSRAGKINCPIILITAKNDMLFPLTMMQDTLDEIQAPQKKLICLEAGGHLAAVSKYYAMQIAAYISENCAGLGLPLHITQR